MTLLDATEDPDCGAGLTDLMEKAGPGSDTVVMAGYMAKEYLAYEARGGDGGGSEGLFGPYLSTLPWERGANGQEHVLFWSDDDVEKNLGGTFCYDETVALREELDLAVKYLNGIIGPSVRSARGEDVESENDDEGAFKWPWEAKEETAAKGMVEGVPEAVRGAFVSLLTRSFEDASDGEVINREKLVPLLDMLQHSVEPNVQHAMRKTDGTVVVEAIRDMVAGTELLNQYRPEEEETMPNHRFFSRFGFVPGKSNDDIPGMLADKQSAFYPQQAEV